RCAARFYHSPLLPLVPTLPIYLRSLNHTSTTVIYTLSLHDALPIYNSYISRSRGCEHPDWKSAACHRLWYRWETSTCRQSARARDRKSTRLNSSHQIISYAVFCLKKTRKPRTTTPLDSKYRPTSLNR